MRQVLEPAVAFLAAGRLTPSSGDNLAAILDAMGQARNLLKHFGSLDLQFHAAIAESSGNRVMARSPRPYSAMLTNAYGSRSDRKPPSQNSHVARGLLRHRGRPDPVTVFPVRRGREDQPSYPVTVVRCVLRVSPSGFWTWAKRPPSARSRSDAKLTATISAIHHDNRWCTHAPDLCPAPLRRVFLA